MWLSTNQHKACSAAADSGTTSYGESDENDEATNANQWVHQHQEHIHKLLTTRQDADQPLLVKERPQTDR